MSGHFTPKPLPQSFVQNWQPSCLFALFVFCSQKLHVMNSHSIPWFGNRHRMTRVELLSFVVQVSIYIPYDYIWYSGQKQILSVNWDVLNDHTVLYTCKLSFLRTAREFDNGLVIHYMRKEIFSRNNRHFMASCWKDLAPKTPE